MADGAQESHERGSDHRAVAGDGADEIDQPRAVFRMELRDELPGDAAVVGVEVEGEFMWIGSRKHMDDQARDEFVEQLTQIVERGWWVQNWRGARA
ncbi:MAG: hypothetical protein LBV60_13785 [Streptomyces sp.]|jgi:hypothetical protein|nr:hypothetical protein [Streptomyces sp.]